MGKMRTDILERKEEILQWIDENRSKAYMCKQLLCKQETLNSYLKKMGIEYAGKQNWRKNKTGTQSNNYIPVEQYITRDSIDNCILKSKLLYEGYKQKKCEYCGLSEWEGQSIPLELHHEDGNHFNNSLDNLALICPNCHALQNNNDGANVGYYSEKAKELRRMKRKKYNNDNRIICPVCNNNTMLSTSSMCEKCRKKSQRTVERPSRETLKQLIRTTPFTTIGKNFGVSDNAIRKWCDYYNLPRKSSEIKQYTEEEWLKI